MHACLYIIILATASIIILYSTIYSTCMYVHACMLYVVHAYHACIYRGCDQALDISYERKQLGVNGPRRMQEEFLAHARGSTVDDSIWIK